ncbi:MAG: acyl-protein synthetase [Oscillospiraceae bacterium]|nr:acyl-protein synthetase [Oscillospiraceae bacterium]
MKYRRRLFRQPEPYDTEGTDELFAAAARENCSYAYAHCPEYKTILDAEGFSPDGLQSAQDLASLPFIPTALFKRRRLLSIPRRRLPVVVTSSGTSGHASEIGFSFGDLWAGLKMVLRVCRQRRLISPKPCHYVVFGYQPNRHNRTGVSKTAFGVTLFTPALSRTYALRWQDGKYVLDLKAVQAAIVKHSRSRFPLRFMGFPSYAWFLMKQMDDQGVRVQLPKGSKLMLGGGWKQFYTEEVEKPVFYALAKKVLGLEETDIIEFYGAVEHPILYCDCERHHFHVPIYSRVLIRDARTFEPVQNGTPGLVNLISPMVCGTPLLSVMTDDLGVLRDGCACGRKSPYLEILGRVGLSDIKTCAAGASEILNGTEVSL